MFPTTPFYWSMISEEIYRQKSLLSLTCVMFGGERLSRETILRLRSEMPHVKIKNLYGPAECSINASIWTLPEHSEEVYLGKPIGQNRYLRIRLIIKRVIGRNYRSTLYFWTLSNERIYL